jgi:hypothetical protein
VQPRQERGYRPPQRWAEELALLGTLPDKELAQQIGRSVTVVRVMRNRQGISSRTGRVELVPEMLGGRFGCHLPPAEPSAGGFLVTGGGFTRREAKGPPLSWL